ncbi:MAG: hypothetical protein LBO71_09040 [Prevotellaceae bacterium]|jgi:hypothetical protein|nr:hypothetical protein [Prevotellaceae bacterium]
MMLEFLAAKICHALRNASELAQVLSGRCRSAANVALFLLILAAKVRKISAHLNLVSSIRKFYAIRFRRKATARSGCLTVGVGQRRAPFFSLNFFWAIELSPNINFGYFRVKRIFTNFVLSNAHS